MTAGQIRAPTCIPLRSTPGSKQNIDDDTPIELSCGTDNTTIFYTINGEKPVAFDNKNKHTHTYSRPFLLPPGKRTIKSVAAYPDGRESNIVTKVYYVRDANPIEDLECLSLDSQLDRNYSQEEDMFKRRVLAESFRNNIQTLPAGGLYTASRAKNRGASLSPGREPPTSPTAAPVQLRGTPSKGSSSPGTPSRKRRSMKIATDVMKQVRIEEDSIQTNMTFTKETDKCPQCFTDKPPNPLAKYCHQCQFYLPPNQVDVGTVKCLHCHSVIPADVTQCVVCHATITSQLLVLPTDEPITCRSCRVKNPPGSKTCVMCEERLVLTIQPPPPPPPLKLNTQAQENSRHCKKCVRDNSLEARYCDWCGSSMVDLSTPLSCKSCSFQNPPLALYCGNCSLSLLPPAPPPSDPKPAWSDEIPDTPVSANHVILPRAPLLVTTDTQTDGIFYKSAKRLQEEENKTTDNMKQVYRSRGLSVTKFSPGGGNWRQNIDHITNHIKVYSQLNSEYQEIIGKHQFGKVAMATLYKDMDELHVSYVFTSKKKASKMTNNRKSASLTSIISSGPKNHSLKKRASICSNTASELSELLAGELKNRKEEGKEANGITITKTKCLLNDDSLNPPPSSTNDELGGSKTSLLSHELHTDPDKPIPRGSKSDSDHSSFVRDTSNRKSMKKKIAPKDMHDLRIGKLNSQLLSEILKEGDEHRVNRMIGQGADVNTKSSGGVPILCLAAKNKHFGTFRVLANKGADINCVVPSTKDSPLHIAVQQGSQDIVKFLVKQGADFMQPNIQGKTPLDVAKERHNQRAVQLFTASMGSNLLGIK